MTFLSLIELNYFSYPLVNTKVSNDRKQKYTRKSRVYHFTLILFLPRLRYLVTPKHILGLLLLKCRISKMSDDDENKCPLCIEEMDLSDKNFLPCPCGYKVIIYIIFHISSICNHNLPYVQVCMWCWHHIRENLNGLCPNCRTPYNADPHAFSAVGRDE